MRFYIVIPFSNEVKMRFSDCINKLKLQTLDGKFTPAQNLQLSFFSISATDNVNGIKEAIDAVTFEPFGVEVGGYGINNRRSGNMHYSQVKPCNELPLLYDALKKELSERQIPFDDVEMDLKFALARDVEPIQNFNPGAFSHTVPKVSMTVDTLVLIKSDETGRLCYTEEYKREVAKKEELPQIETEDAVEDSKKTDVTEEPKGEEKVGNDSDSKKEKEKAPGFFARLFGKK